MDEKRTVISGFAEHARKPDPGSAALKGSISVCPDYWPFNGQPQAHEKYWRMRLAQDIERASRGRDPQCVWADELYDALHVVAKEVRAAAAPIKED